MESTIKLLLAILFLVCLLDMPYGFYQFVRFTAMVGFAVLAYQASEKENKTEMIIYTGLAILFQPLMKISLGRQLWNIVDVIVAVGLLYSVWKERKAQNDADSV
jgi:hypothetical protein